MPYDGDVRNFETLEVRALRAARDAIAGGWCQGGSGLSDARGVFVSDFQFDQATSFCLARAVQKGSYVALGYGCRPPNGGPNQGPIINLQQQMFQLIAPTVANIDVVRWNDADGRTQSEVLAKFDEAISRASALTEA